MYNEAQDVLRHKLVNISKRKGIKYIYLANLLNVSKSLLSAFKNGKKNLNEHTYNRLEKILNEIDN